MAFYQKKDKTEFFQAFYIGQYRGALRKNEWNKILKLFGWDKE